MLACVSQQWTRTKNEALWPEGTRQEAHTWKSLHVISSRMLSRFMRSYSLLIASASWLFSFTCNHSINEYGRGRYGTHDRTLDKSARAL